MQPTDYLVGADAALVVWLERDVHATVVDGRGAAARPDCGADRRDRGILQQRVDQRLLALGHGRVGDILGRLGQAENQPGVLLGKEALGNRHVEVAGQDDGAEHHQQGDETMPQHDLEAGFIEREQAVEAALIGDKGVHAARAAA